MTTRQIFYEGRVQGVGFRWTIKRIATGYDVSGWVRNLDDGRVEMQVMGEEAEVEAFLNGVGESELKAHIRNTEAHPAEPLQDVRGFEIRT